MPILQVTNPAIAPIDSTFRSLLPPSVGDDLPLFRALTVARFGQNHMENGVKLAAHLGRKVATTIGWESLEVPELRTLTERALATLPPEAVAQIFEALKVTIPEALQLLRPVSDAIEAAISGVPILGWIARIGFATWSVVESARNATVPAEAVALGYDQPEDDYIANEMLRLAGGGDWSSIFEPPPGDFDWQTIAYTSSGAADGVAWGQLERDDASAWGMAPGVAAVAGYWQSPRNAPGSSRFADRSAIIGQQQLLPSSTSLAGELWANMQRPTPALGRVDFVGLRTRWEQYGDRLRAFAEREPDNERGRWARDQMLAAWSWYGPGGGTFYDVNPASVPSQYRRPELDALIGYKCDVAWSRAVQSMQTHAAAYLTSDSPLVRNDPGLQSVLDRARRELVEGRSDVVLVDTTLVPDVGYRNAIIAAKSRAEGQQSSGQSTPEFLRRLRERLARLRDGGPKPDLPAQEGGASGGAGLLFLAVVLLGALAWSRR